MDAKSLAVAGLIYLLLMACSMAPAIVLRRRGSRHDEDAHNESGPGGEG